MIEIATRFMKINNQWVFVPYSDEDLEHARDLKPYQILRSTFKGPRNQRSYTQLKAYFACCRKVAENTENPDFNTKDKVDLQLRIKLGWIKESLLVDKRVQFIPKSISFKEMKHLEACNYFERAFETMAKFLSVTVEELLKNVNA